MVKFLKKNPEFGLFLAALFIKLTLLPFAHTVDSDAVSRIFIAQRWLENPYWITQSTWGPFHFYILGLALFVWNNVVLAPKVLTILFSCFTIFPFYHFVKQEFNTKNGAFFSTYLLIVSPVLFRNSFQALSGAPFLFFLALTLFLIAKFFETRKILLLLISGISLTIACAIRYEGWLLLLLLSMIIWMRSSIKFSVFFFCFGALFPMLWIYGNYAELGSFEGFSKGYNWGLEFIEKNDNPNFDTILRRIWYFPFSWMICVGPITVFFIVKYLILIIKDSSKRNQLIWAIPFLVLFISFIYKSLNGSLVHQHRFTGTLVVLSLPFFAHVTNRKWAIGAIITTFGLSFAWNTGAIKPLPRLSESSDIKIAELIQDNMQQNTSLFIDFIDWESTYYYALKSKKNQHQRFMLNHPNERNEKKEQIIDFIEKSERTVIVMKAGSEAEIIFKSLNKNKLNDFIYSDDRVKIALLE